MGSVGLRSTNSSNNIAGRWDATIQINGIATPFPLEISGSGANVTATFFNGDERYPCNEGGFENGKLSVFWDYYAATLEGTLKDGFLDGQYVGTRRMKGPFAIHAKRAVASAMSSARSPDISGLWVIPNKSGKGELAWRFVVQQSGGIASATILRVDGDTGTISGAFQNDKFVLSHFNGARAHLLQITPPPTERSNYFRTPNTKLTAYRPAAARAKGLPEPTDPEPAHLYEGSQGGIPLEFPDLNGQACFQYRFEVPGKVVVVEITGSWSPTAMTKLRSSRRCIASMAHKDWK